jgi:trk system potassium uptake protein TrkH
MFIAGANFPLIVKALTAKPSSLFKSQELRYYFFIVCFVSMIISSVLVLVQGYEIKTAIREALFQVTSFISTTGYVVADYTLWIPPLWLILFFLMLIGSCSGSSGGGIKIMRQMILLKNTSNSIKNIVNPNAVFGVRIDGKIINQDIIYNVLAYCFIYLISFAIGSFLISLIGMDFKSAIGIAASAIGNIGPGLGYPGSLPVYDTLPVAGKWIMCALMFIGRLEFFTVFILFFPSFWKK